MYFKSFKSNKPQTPYAPVWDFTVGVSLCENINLKQIILSKEKEIKKLPILYDENHKVIDGYTGLGKNSTTSKFQIYNLLTWDYPEIKVLKENIKKNLILYNENLGNETPDKVWIQCWTNVLRFGQKIKPHAHSFSEHCYLSGHFNVSVDSTSTVYMSPINQINKPEVIQIKNEINEMTLFPSYIFHYTTPHYKFTPRITIAFDMALFRPNLNWIEL